MKTKNLILATILFVTTLLNAQTKTVDTPNPCDELKKENEALKKSLNINEPITILTDNDIEFKITKVKGDIKTQMVTIELLLTNKIKNREVGINKGAMKIVSIEGDVCAISDKIDHYNNVFNESNKKVDLV